MNRVPETSLSIGRVEPRVPSAGEDGFTVVRRTSRRPEQRKNSVTFSAGGLGSVLERNLRNIENIVPIAVANSFGSLEEDTKSSLLRESVIRDEENKENENICPNSNLGMRGGQGRGSKFVGFGEKTKRGPHEV